MTFESSFDPLLSGNLETHETKAPCIYLGWSRPPSNNLERCNTAGELEKSFNLRKHLKTLVCMISGSFRKVPEVMLNFEAPFLTSKTWRFSQKCSEGALATETINGKNEMHRFPVLFQMMILGLLPWLVGSSFAVSEIPLRRLKCPMFGKWSGEHPS